MGPDERPFVACRSRRITKDSSSRGIMHLVPVFYNRDAQPDEQQMFAQIRPGG